MRSFRNLPGSFSFSSIFTKTLIHRLLKTVSIILAGLLSKALITGRVWPIKCLKTSKDLCNTQNKASLRSIDLFSFSKRTRGWVYSNRKTGWRAVDRLVFKNLIRSKIFGVRTNLRPIMKTSINLNEWVKYLRRLRRSYLRRHSLTRIISAWSHLLPLARQFHMCSRGSRRLVEHKIH